MVFNFIIIIFRTMTTKFQLKKNINFRIKFINDQLLQGSLFAVSTIITNRTKN